MQKIKFIGYSNTLFQNKILEETIFYFANKSGFKIEKLEYNFVDLNAMRSLNVDFLSHDNHTDILTFDYSEEKNLIAEVYISLSMMRENAKKYKQSIYIEIQTKSFLSPWVLLNQHPWVRHPLEQCLSIHKHIPLPYRRSQLCPPISLSSR